MRTIRTTMSMMRMIRPLPRAFSVFDPLHIEQILMATLYGPANMGPRDVKDHYIRLGSCWRSISSE
jgi:hypothetical protein